MLLKRAYSCLLLAWIAVTGEANTCGAFNTNGTPISHHRTCSVYQDGFCDCPHSEGSWCHEWRSGYCPEIQSQCYPLKCPGFVAMNLTYKCSFDGAQLYKYRDGVYQYLNGHSVNYGLLLPEHAGLYECRNSTNHTVHAQNLTVNGKSIIYMHA